MKYIKSYEQNIKPVIDYFPNGQKYYEYYQINDNLHRTDGPAYQKWFETGQKELEVYLINNQRHRTDGPAYQKWFETGQIEREEYWQNGNIHNEKGPAIRFWYKYEILNIEEYYLNHIKFANIEDWLNKLKELNSPHYKHQLLKYESEKYNI
jgi:hypothetical protein